MYVRNTGQKYILMVIAEGFEEIETIVLLGSLRQAGLCVKSVGLISGPISSAQGVYLMPDLTLTDLDHLIDITAVSAVILPQEKRSLTRLESDPRVHRLLRQVVAQDGQIVTSPEGLRISRMAAVWGDEPAKADGQQRTSVLLRKSEQSPQAFVQDLIRRLKR